MPRLERTRFALSEVEEYLNYIEEPAPLIEIFLVSYLTISFYSEMEEHVKQIYQNRLNFNGDARLEFFIHTTNEAMMRRVKISEISDLANCFGDDCRDNFRNNLDERDVQAYSSVISNRHRVAHGRGGNLTIGDIRTAIIAADCILESLENAIR